MKRYIDVSISVETPSHSPPFPSLHKECLSVSFNLSRDALPFSTQCLRRLQRSKRQFQSQSRRPPILHATIGQAYVDAQQGFNLSRDALPFSTEIEALLRAIKGRFNLSRDALPFSTTVSNLVCNTLLSVSISVETPSHSPRAT